ncbi:MAG: MBL fold metallo-hydrolase [Dehalococcoidia bacterium]|jgi:glyoxylase-like metal-dependent hydrolase (beta-lactamase superfamily II)
MMEVMQGVYKISGIWDQADLGANVYLLALGGGFTLVDAGYRNKYRQILKRIYRLGFTPTRIHHIIVTHHHPDHVGGLAALKGLTGAKVIAHKLDAPYIDGRMPQAGPSRPGWLKRRSGIFSDMLATPPCPVDIEVEDGNELPVAGGIKIIHTPGHTPGSICIYLKQERLVFTGDILARRLGVKLPSMVFTADVQQEISSIRKLAELDFETACFGHGFPLRKDAGKIVAKFANKLKVPRQALNPKP